MKIGRGRAGHQVDLASRDPPPARSNVSAHDVASARPRASGRGFAAATASRSNTRASATELERQRTTWLNRIFLLAGGVAAAATILGYASGFGWYSLVAALPTFVASSVATGFVLALRDQRLAIKKRLLQGKRRRKSRGRRPAPAVYVGAQAPSAERGGRVLAALPAAPL